MRMKLAACALALAVFGCSQPVEPPPDPEAAAEVGQAEPLPRALPPPTEQQPRYVGQWATSAEGCAEPAWRFEERGVTTRGEVACTFDTVTLTPTGYDIAATCTAEAPPAPYQIQLSFAESARAMMIAGGPWSAPTSLVYCGA
ncbi:MAG TPA: hypothetical protein VEA80_18025 [Vitreimonas sp.]|uniref:hypothetical protein n=1 Tax=Vitreimonas sp. TaxID=3069702 RepID=UPI002D34926A|nr:hypothetical protein [Vitreimonas sp.]HYD89382.1 hypothetical protein [Vitreimonas sp.]